MGEVEKSQDSYCQHKKSTCEIHETYNAYENTFISHYTNNYKLLNKLVRIKLDQTNELTLDIVQML